MKTLKDCEYSTIVAGVVSAKLDNENPKAKLGPKEDFIQGLFFTAGSLIMTKFFHIIFGKNENKEKGESH